jgi:hypothetical protein
MTPKFPEVKVTIDPAKERWLTVNTCHRAAKRTGVSAAALPQIAGAAIRDLAASPAGLRNLMQAFPAQPVKDVIPTSPLFSATEKSY